MKKYIAVLAIISLAACQSDTHTIELKFDPALELQAISTIMDAQEKSWNQGNINAFMIPYWHSDSLLFIGKSGVNKGWQKTLDNYKKSYPTSEAMGRLEFENISMEILDEQHAWVLGKWTLFRVADTLSGHYTLNWRKMKNQWFIISDHSS
jgi:hypothetical protein